MKIMYSASTNGFYLVGVNSSIPDDAVSVTNKRHAELLAGQSAGKVISPDSKGRPTLIDPPRPTPTSLEDAIRIKRDSLLKESDWVTLRAYEANEPVPEEWAVYRQALRDIPQQDNFPDEIHWPDRPGAN